MADNLTFQTTVATPPAGAVVATDDAGAGGHVQIVKLAISTDASATPIPADVANGMDVDVTRLPALVAGSANIGDVDIASIAAGDTNIGNVDIVTVPAPLSTTGGGTEATALRVTLANDSTGLVSVDDNAGSLTVDAPLGTPVHVRLSDGTDAGLLSAAGAALVDVASMPNEGQQTMANSISVAVASDQSAVPVSQNGTWTVQPGNTANTTPWLESLRPGTSGGLTTFHLVGAATTNATNIKASAGQVFGWYIYNANAAMRKVAFHNTAGAPTAGASIFFTLCIPPTSAANVFSDVGIAFSTGIAITTVTGFADSDATAIAATDLNINIYYA